MKVCCWFQLQEQESRKVYRCAFSSISHHKRSHTRSIPTLICSQDLSGGERNRVHLAKLLKANANVLLLDEPTNDIDVEVDFPPISSFSLSCLDLLPLFVPSLISLQVLRSLEEGISEFPGSLIIVSHDRWFLDRVATHILAFEGYIFCSYPFVRCYSSCSLFFSLLSSGSHAKGDEVTFFEGNYTQYEKALRKRKGNVDGKVAFISLKKRGQ